MRALAAHISLAAVAFAAATDGVASRQWSTYAPLGSAVATAAWTTEAAPASTASVTGRAKTCHHSQTPAFFSPPATPPPRDAPSEVRVIPGCAA